jgi:hypothetical protein
MAYPWEKASESGAMSEDIEKQPSPSLFPLTPFPGTSTQMPESKPAIETKDDQEKSQPR